MLSFAPLSGLVMHRVLLLLAVLVFVPAEVSAHIQLRDPAQRTDRQKTGPCGSASSTPGPVVATYLPGETVTVIFDEGVNHPGHFCVVLDDMGQDFLDPTDYDGCPAAPFQLGKFLDDATLDKQGERIRVQVTLPQIECSNCVLQVTQMMTDKPPYGDGNDLYYQCSDIAIVAPPTCDPACGVGEVCDAVTGTCQPDGTADMGMDAGVTADATSGADTSGADAGGAPDSSAAADTGGSGGGDTASAPDGGPSDLGGDAAALDTSGGGDSGCGCTIRGGSSRAPIVSAVALTLFGLIRLRKRPQA